MTANAITPAPAERPDALAKSTALALDLATREAHAKAERLALAEACVETDEEYAEATAARAEYRREADELEAAYKAAVRPWQAVVTAIQAAFRPAKAAYADLDAHVGGLLGRYQVAKANALRAAEAAAQAAAKADDTPGTLTALAKAQEAAAPLQGGAVRWTWRVVRVAADLLPREWWRPDHERIEAFAAAHKGEDAPVIPGVVFERVASVAVQRRSK